MALLTKIRNRLGPFIAILIGLSLGIFVLETALNSNTSLLRGNKDVVGVIDGNKIDIREFDSRVDTLADEYKLQSQQTSLDDNTMNQIRDQIWNQYINDHVNAQEYAKLGLAVSPDELKDMFMGKDPIPEIKQNFTNPQTGIFDPQVVANYIQHLDDQGQNEQPGERRARWVAFEKGQKEQRIQNKYQALIGKAVYVPTWMAQETYDEQNAKAAISFVQVPYTTIADSTIKVSDADIQTYINNNKAKFKQDESRALEYVVFQVKPSSDDSAAVKKEIDDIYAKLAAAPNDTDILKLNADNGIDLKYYPKDKITSAFIKDTLFKVPVGTLIGPYLEDNAYKIAKLTDRLTLPDSAKAKHILVAVQEGADTVAAYKKIDSIYNAWKAGAPFDSLAIAFSDDKGSAQKGGELGYFPEGIMVNNFNRYVFFTGKTGESKIVRTEFGYHLIVIEDQKNFEPFVQYDLVTRPLEASTATDKVAFDKATQFAAASNSKDAFEKTITNDQYQKQSAPQVLKTSYELPGVTNARQVIKWAYQAKLNDVSPVFNCDNNYVVALLTGIKDEGTMSVADARPQAELQVKKEKKGSEILQQLSAAGSTNLTLDAVASKFNQPVKTASNVAFSSSFAAGLGYEPKVVGEIFTLKPNQLSNPILGEQAVYVIKLDSVSTPAPIADYTQYKNQLVSSTAPRLQYGLNDALKKSVKIEDDRYLFF